MRSAAKDAVSLIPAIVPESNDGFLKKATSALRSEIASKQTPPKLKKLKEALKLSTHVALRFECMLYNFSPIRYITLYQARIFYTLKT